MLTLKRCKEILGKFDEDILACFRRAASDTRRTLNTGTRTLKTIKPAVGDHSFSTFAKFPKN